MWLKMESSGNYINLSFIFQDVYYYGCLVTAKKMT